MQENPANGSTSNKSIFYDQGTIKVVVFACFIIVLAVVFTGSVSYFITRNAVVEKLQSRDLIYIIESIAAKIDGRMERAKETSLILAQDATIREWVAGAEQDVHLGNLSKDKINHITQSYDYANSFVVSAITQHYWAEGSQMIQVMSKSDPNAKWFYNALQSGQAVDLNLDYNSSRNDTFVFVNALIGNINQPLAVAGVGLSLQELAQEFQSYKIGQNSNLWLVDSTGKIYLSDNLADKGMYLNDFLPTEVTSQIIENVSAAPAKPIVMEYQNKTGQTMDLVYTALKSSNWRLVFQIPRSESIAILSNIQLNTAIAGSLSLVLMVFVFYMISRRIANPLQRAVQLNQEMNKQVRERTRELAEKNEKILDSIDYAKRLQEAILPSPEEFISIFKHHAVLWQPKDIVGGDFYWIHRMDSSRSLVAVGDCTGHGVPGAFMTMAVSSILNQIVNKQEIMPAQILAELNRKVKETLHRNDQTAMTDDGLDLAICLLENSSRLIYAGTKIPLYIKRENQIHMIKGDRKSIGYRRSSEELQFTNHVWEVRPGDEFYLTTDGYTDQNGGSKDYPLGRKGFMRAISEHELAQQADHLAKVLADYRGAEPQRDDITVLGFSL